MKTTTQLAVAAVALFASSVMSLGSVYYFLYELRDDVRVVNAAGIVRGGTQRLVNLELAGQKSDELIDEIDRLINGLIDGDESLELPAATDPEFLAKNQEIAASWANLKTIIFAVRKNPNQKNILIQNSENHWDLTNDGVFTAELGSKRKNDRYKHILAIILLMDLFFLVIILWLKFLIYYKIQTTIETISISSTAMAAAITEQEEIASKQAIAVNKTNQIIDKLRKFSDHSVEQAIQVNQSASEVKKLVQSGNNTEEQIMSEMATLNVKVETLQTEIMDLREDTKEIANISELVSELANYTNMLALNASMEAARAGENGQAFAVVAREIRKLANQSKKAAEKIYSLVSEIQKSIKSTVVVTNESRNSVDEGVNKTTEMLEAFQKVLNAIDTVFTSGEEITLTAQQQAAIIQEAFEAVEEIKFASQESAGGMDRAKNGMKQLKEVVSNLDAIV